MPLILPFSYSFLSPLLLASPIEKNRRISNIEVIRLENETTLEDLKICSVSCIQNTWFSFRCRVNCRINIRYTVWFLISAITFHRNGILLFPGNDLDRKLYGYIWRLSKILKGLLTNFMYIYRTMPFYKSIFIWIWIYFIALVL